MTFRHVYVWLFGATARLKTRPDPFEREFNSKRRDPECVCVHETRDDIAETSLRL